MHKGSSLLSAFQLKYSHLTHACAPSVFNASHLKLNTNLLKKYVYPII
jgi:hypothetical protein